MPYRHKQTKTVIVLCNSLLDTTNLHTLNSAFLQVYQRALLFCAHTTYILCFYHISFEG